MGSERLESSLKALNKISGVLKVVLKPMHDLDEIFIALNVVVSLTIRLGYESSFDHFV